MASNSAWSPAESRLNRALRHPSTPLLLLAGAALACWVLLLALGSRLTFLTDDWAFLIFRRGFGADQVLDPHNEHIAVIPVLIYKAVLGTFGMTSQQPFRVVSTPVFLTSVVLLFVWLRRRVGDWLALAGVLPILFLGSSGEVVLWPFPQIGFCGPMAAGIGAFLALERSDRRGDIAACALLALAVLWGSLGLAFIAGALVHVAWDRARWQRAFVVAVPLGLYALWWLGWGHQAESHLSLHNLLVSPLYVFDGLASGVASLLALPEIDFSATSSLDPGAPLLVLLAALAVLRVRRLGHVSRWLAVVSATTLAFWFPAALIASEARHATDPRYQYMAAIFTLMIAAELVRGVRVGRRAMAVVFAVARLRDAGQPRVPAPGLPDRALAGHPLPGRSGGTGDRAGGDQSEVRADRRELGGRQTCGSSPPATTSRRSTTTAPRPTRRRRLASAPEEARVTADTVLWRGLPGTIVSGSASPDRTPAGADQRRQPRRSARQLPHGPPQRRRSGRAGTAPGRGVAAA